MLNERSLSAFLVQKGFPRYRRGNGNAAVDLYDSTNTETPTSKAQWPRYRATGKDTNNQPGSELRRRRRRRVFKDRSITRVIRVRLNRDKERGTQREPPTR